jgi:predicted ATPase
MELLFLWVEGFRKIKSEKLNFSSEIMVSVSEEVDGTYVLDLDINDKYVNPFDLSLISLTGIAGKNGSGKSTIMNCLKLLYGNLGILTSPLVFSLLDHETNTISTHFYNGGGTGMKTLNVKVLAKDSVITKYKVADATPYTISNFLDNDQKVKGLGFSFQNIACAYLSNNFDNTQENIYEGIINVSTKARLDNFLNIHLTGKERKIKNSKTAQEEIPKIELWPSHLKDFYKQELRSNIRLISYANGRKRGSLPDLPRSVIITFNFDDYEAIIDTTSNSHYSIDKKDLQKIQLKAGQLLQTETDKRQVFRNLIYLCVFYYSVRNNLFGVNSFSKGDLGGSISSIANSQENIFESINDLLDGLSIQPDKKEETFKIRELLGMKFDNALNRIDFNFDPIYKNQIVDFPFKINNSLWSLLSQVFDFQYGNESAFLDYRWEHDLSTGEQARLNNYSRLYEIKKQIGGKFLMLLIDEGDLYYHPQWQKHYLTDLIDGLDFILSTTKVQLVLTTHSPFILSDIPRQNIIFLDRYVDDEYNVYCFVSKNTSHIQTFGANIHELFTDSFFLQDGLMGEYARNYIDELIKSISKEVAISKDKYDRSYKNRVDLIGEQFIKTKILELIATKAETPLIDEIIEYRSNELDALRQIRQDKQNGKN